MNSTWLPVTKKAPCSNCGSEGWCSYTDNGTVICRKKEIRGGLSRTDKNGTTYWIKSTADYRCSSDTTLEDENRPAIADDVICDRVYKGVLTNLDITQEFIDFGEERGLSIDDLLSLGIKSYTRKNHHKVIKELTRDFTAETLLGVPGFFRTKDGSVDFMNLPPTYFIPVRNLSGQIVRLQLRPVEVRKKSSKYYYFSSRMQGGPECGLCCHIAKPRGDFSIDIVRIAEGILKANIIALKTGILTIGMPGVAQYKMATKELADLALKPLKVLLAIDMDYLTNKFVRDALVKLYEELVKNDYNVAIETWNTRFKGLDDALIVGETISLLEGDTARAYIDELKIEIIRPIVFLLREQLDIETGVIWDAIRVVNLRHPFLFRQRSSLRCLEKNSESLSLSYVTKEILFGELGRRITWKKRNEKGQTRDSHPPAHLLSDLQSFIPDDIPVLEFVSPIPLLRPDGTFAIESGYHCDLRAYLDFNLDLSSVKIHPNLQDVEEAKSLILNEILVDFPFETLSDRANAFGLLFLPFCRPFIDDLTPLHLVSAASPGTGKNLLLDLYSTITADQKLNPRPISNNEEEMRKLITSELLSSPPMILLDNLNDFQSSGVFHSSALASVLTARVWTDRYLGQSKMVSSVNNTIWLMTGNNPSLTSELQRRTSKIKMVSSLQKPWDRTGFRHPNLLLWVKEHRSQIISALMTLINAWVSSGMPFSSKRMGSFERYSSVIGGILESIGIDEFLDNGKMTVDNETATMEVLTGIWYKTFGTRAISASELFGICLAGDFHLDLGIKYFGNSGTQHLAELGVIMKRLNQRVFGCYRLIVQRKKDANRYSLEVISPSNFIEGGGSDDLLF